MKRISRAGLMPRCNARPAIKFQKNHQAKQPRYQGTFRRADANKCFIINGVNWIKV